jgi:hypothetical protein
MQQRKTMSTNETSGQDCIDIEPRTERALTECMTVLPNHGRAAGAPGLFIVVGENDENDQTYLADTRSNTCECGDDEYNLDDQEACKHVRRAEIAAGDRPVPADVLGDIEIDSTFGAQVDASAKFATADGGIIDGETGNLLEENDDEPESESESEVNIWSCPRPEIDPFGNYTGFDIVECTSCEVETIVPLKDTASHKEGCSHE